MPESRTRIKAFAKRVAPSADVSDALRVAEQLIAIPEDVWDRINGRMILMFIGLSFPLLGQNRSLKVSPNSLYRFVTCADVDCWDGDT